MQSLIAILQAHQLYVLLAIGLVVILLFLKILLGRPTRAERDHQRRFDQLKDKNRDKYRHLRHPH